MLKSKSGYNPTDEMSLKISMVDDGNKGKEDQTKTVQSSGWWGPCWKMIIEIASRT